MTYVDERTRPRDVAARLYGMLRELRGAPQDARDFQVFDRRDDWKDLGVGDDQIAAVDLTDDAALEKHIADAGAMARALGHVDENDSIGGDEGQDVLWGGAGNDTLAMGAEARFQPGHGVTGLADLRRKQAEFKAQARDWSRGEDAGGLYGDVGLGIGPGFNLHLDRLGVTPSVGAGYFGTAKLGYADDLQALLAQRRNDRVFGGLRVGRYGLGLEAKYRADPRGLAIDRVTGSIGPVEAGIDRRGWTIDMPLELGAEAGSGALKTLPPRPWKR